MDTSDFYANIKEIKSFKDISTSSFYKHMSKDWYVIATDVAGSTKAIEQGKYKEVNMVGALTIISILNINKKVDLPFVFGGDGAFVLIPPLLLEDSKQALLAVQKISMDAYGLNLRIGIIPIKDIYDNDKEMLITKFKISKDYAQAMIRGGGLEFCDVLLKESDKYEIKDKIDENFQVDIEGLECRWEAIKSPKDETLSILIKAKDETYYKHILEELDTILGTVQIRHPITKKNTKLSFNDKILAKEASLSTQNNILKKLVIYKLKLLNYLGKFLMEFSIGQWGGYKDRILSTTDTEKFDDMLRMVVSTNYTQTKKLEEYLEEEYEKKNLLYGIHKSDSSLMTCLIFERHGKHIHFVDASNGGYAMAAKGFKKQSF